MSLIRCIVRRLEAIEWAITVKGWNFLSELNAEE